MSQQMVMRREILALFAYPRQLAMANIDLSSCPHGGFFKAMDASCRQCAKNYECVWLNSTDEFNGLAGKSMEFLYRALTFGIDYVDARFTAAARALYSSGGDTGILWNLPRHGGG